MWNRREINPTYVQVCDVCSTTIDSVPILQQQHKYWLTCARFSPTRRSINAQLMTDWKHCQQTKTGPVCTKQIYGAGDKCLQGENWSSVGIRRKPRCLHLSVTKCNRDRRFPNTERSPERFLIGAPSSQIVVLLTVHDNQCSPSPSVPV